MKLILTITLFTFLVVQSSHGQDRNKSIIWKEMGYQVTQQDLYKILDLSTDFSLVKKWERIDSRALKHVKYQLLYKGSEIFGSEIVTHFDSDNNLSLINGSVPSKIKANESLFDAYSIMLSSELISGLEKDQQVSKKLNLTSHKWEFHNDKGDHLFSFPLAKNFSDTGTAVTKYSGIQKIITTKTENNYYVLSEVRKGVQLITYNAETKDIELLTSDFTKVPDFETLAFFKDVDNFWDNENDKQDELATDIHWSTAKTFDYFLEKHEWLSIDGVGGDIISIAHIGQNWDEAFYIEPPFNFMGYGDGGPIGANATLDIIAHEFTHAVVQYSAGLIYIGESSTLDEGLADIFSAAVKFYVNLPHLKTPWVLAEQLGSYRNMANPKAEFQPDTYKGQFWYYGNNRKQFAHQNNGVLNYWFYLLTEGGSGQNDNGYQYSIDGIGIEKSAQITFETMSFYLTSLSGFFDFKEATIQVVTNNYGENSNELVIVKECWKAVGVVEIITSVERQLSDNVLVALNQNYLSIKSSSYPITKTNIRLIDLSGKRISIKLEAISELEYRIHTSMIPTGVYVLQISDNHFISTKKVLVKNN